MLCILDNYLYKYTFRICNTYCFSTSTMVLWTHLNVTFICTLLVLFQIFLPDFVREYVTKFIFKLLCIAIVYMNCPWQYVCNHSSHTSFFSGHLQISTVKLMYKRAHFNIKSSFYNIWTVYAPYVKLTIYLLLIQYSSQEIWLQERDAYWSPANKLTNSIFKSLNQSR